MYEALSYRCGVGIHVRVPMFAFEQTQVPSATSVSGLKLLVYQA